MKSTIDEGKVEVLGYQLFYRKVGTDGIPLLCLHGGPGGNRCYLEPLEQLSQDRAVVFYDQLGCGDSAHPRDPSLWTSLFDTLHPGVPAFGKRVEDTLFLIGPLLGTERRA